MTWLKYRIFLRIRGLVDGHKHHNRIGDQPNLEPLCTQLKLLPLADSSSERLILAYSMHSSLVPGYYNLSFCNPYRLL